MLGLLYEYSIPICRQHQHGCQAGLFVLSLSLQANKLERNTGEDKQAADCQAFFFFETE